MFHKKYLFILLSVLVIASMALSACAPAATEAPAAPAEEATAPAEAAAVTGKVGIVLPTKDEPRWIQDETRFKDALTAAGYDVQILFSQGDSAKEKDNVESLISQGIQVLIIYPAGRSGRSSSSGCSQGSRCEGYFV